MRVTSVELRPEGSSEVIDLSFRDPRSLNPYQCKSIAPLDADELTPQFYGTSGDSAKKYYQLVQNKREPVVLIGLNPRFGGVTENSYSELRDRLYRLIQSSRTGIVQIVFKDGDVDVAAIQGTVSKFEASLFTEKPEVQITFDCKDPMLKSLERVQLLSGTTFTSDLIVSDEMSTAVHGFRFQATFLGNESTLVIDPPSHEWKFDIRPHDGFNTGDILVFSSEPRDKQLYIQRGSTKIYLADVLQPGFVWPIIFPGENPLHFSHALAFSSLDHYVTYWGV